MTDMISSETVEFYPRLTKHQYPRSVMISPDNCTAAQLGEVLNSTLCGAQRVVYRLTRTATEAAMTRVCACLNGASMMVTDHHSTAAQNGFSH